MGLLEKLKIGLKKTKDAFFGNVIKALKGGKIDEEILEEIEEMLILSDVGVETTQKIIEELKKNANRNKDLLILLKEIMLENIIYGKIDINPKIKPYVILVVGVNGTGKTTTIGKLAKMYIDNRKSVVLAAADTFRAAAIEQLKFWGEKVGATVISHFHGSDAAAVVFDAIAHAKSKNKDIIIIDTAGRLHTKHNLMEELKKIKKVISKEIEGAPHETLLVLDATTGQNGIVQAKVFKEAIDITGIVLTKLDGTAKGGIAFSISKELKIPIKLVGIGEKEDDLQPFDPEIYLDALLDIERKEEKQ